MKLSRVYVCMCRCERVLEDHVRPVLSLAVAGNRLFSGSYDYTIKVWCLDSLQRLKTLTGGGSTPLCWPASGSCCVLLPSYAAMRLCKPTPKCDISH